MVVYRGPDEAHWAAQDSHHLVSDLSDLDGLILLTGYPCSGLTYRARQLATLFESLQSSLPATSKSRYKIHIVTSHDEAHPRTVYDNAKSEKQARAVVYARVKRLLGRDSIVIVDGMNYIKGWRYQLWCESKEARTTSCVVHVGTPIDQCISTNEARLKRKREMSETCTQQPEPASVDPDVKKMNEPEDEPAPKNTDIETDEEPYPPELLTNLIYRYEEPSTASRWDKPLFTVPRDDTTPPVEDIWFAITGQQITKDENQAGPSSGLFAPTDAEQDEANSTAGALSTATAAKKIFLQQPTSTRPKIVPHQATAAPPKTDPTALYVIEKTTSEIISTIRKYSLEHRSPSSSTYLANPQAPGITIPIPSTQTSIYIPPSTLASAPTDDLAGAGGVLTLPRLQRLRRQWVGMNRAFAGHGHGMGQGKLNGEEVGEAFVRFLNAEFEGMTEF
ncbi:RNA polymerase II elongator complex subunit [Trichophyton interdigitale]|uniref:RNA polymerase II elongator complex subunit n=1 Tax=Trichophyton interdigitale TaxID=101480 RepID=A0A9P5CX26_9EURO|nr:RNA polymerase II elongator complex subunit [Trichophyton interdigitale]KAF3899272.1 RNA polymerase II elongator complex subunit [Trichophyton interdigitale]KAG8210757.1 RNA polymerase II elongator complex subunit [Trichophyton interdigitale]